MSQEGHEGLFARAMLGGRLRRNLTQEQLASRCGVQQNWISQNESGYASPTERTLDRVAKGLGVSTLGLLIEEVAPELKEVPPLVPCDERVLSVVCRQLRVNRRITFPGMAAKMGFSRPSPIAKAEHGGPLGVSEKHLLTLFRALHLTPKAALKEALFEHHEEPRIPFPEPAVFRLGELRARARMAIARGDIPRQGQLADELGIRRETFSRFVSGARGLSDVEAEALASALSKLPTPDPSCHEALLEQYESQHSARTHRASASPTRESFRP
jgi:transcriptional regulator with XRE-family HTH domain